jgi:hypothetical protein
MIDTTKIIEIKTDEDYANYLLRENQEAYNNNIVLIADLRPDKNIIMCSLDFGFGRNNVSMLSDFIKDRFDNNHGLPDKIYITFTTEPYLKMGQERVLSNVIETGFYVEINPDDDPTPNEDIECVFINGDLGVESNVKRYCGEIPVTIGNVKFYGFPFGLLSRTRKRLIYAQDSNKITNYYMCQFYRDIPTGHFLKHFVCLNGVPNLIRIKLLTWLHETNIIEKCHWSWLKRHPEGTVLSDNWNNMISKTDGINTAIFDFEQTKELDMSLEDLEIGLNQDRISHSYYLNNSLIDIGVETVPEKYQFFTEKTWKPYLVGKVSLFFNCQSYYAILKNLGFELYDEIFDYSFDTIIDIDERLSAYFNEIKRISEIPLEELQTKILGIEDKILRNRNHAWNCDITTISPFKEYPTLLP